MEERGGSAALGPEEVSHPISIQLPVIANVCYLLGGGSSYLRCPFSCI